MNNEYKLYQIIASLGDKEVKTVRKMLRSPFFTQSEKVFGLYETLVKYKRKKRPFPTPEVLFYQVYSNQPFNYATLRGCMSDLLAFIEEFWCISYLRNNPLKSKLIITEVYRQKNLDKSFKSAAKKVSHLLEAWPLRNAEYYQHLVEFQNVKMKHQTSTQRTEDVYLQEISDNYDILYLTQKLQIICAQLSHQLVRKRDYDIGLLNLLLQEIGKDKYLEYPVISIYYHCFSFMSAPQQEDNFHKFKGLLSQHRKDFSMEDLSILYRLAINFCIRNSNQGKNKYFQELWQLYKDGLEQGILWVNNNIPRFTFNNAVVAGLRIKAFDWVKSFIAQYSSELEVSYQESTIKFNLAKLAYAQEQYKEALLHLHQTEFKDLMNNMVSKILLVKIYFELAEFQTLESHLDAFQQFIRRKEVSDYHRKNILNLVRYVKKISALPDYDKKEKLKLRDQIQSTEILSEREWLLLKIIN